MQKYRVICPHCEVSLLVTGDLLGQSGTCPGCQADFLLPSEESFSITAADTVPSEAQPTTTQPTTSPVIPRERIPVPPNDPPSSIDPLRSLTSGPAPQTSPQKPVRMESRPALRMLAGLMKVLAGVQVLAGCVILIILLVRAIQVPPPPPEQVLLTIGVAIAVGTSAIPMLAFAELIGVFLSQEEMLRHLVNHHRRQSSQE